MSKEHPHKDTPIYQIIMKLFKLRNTDKLSRIESDILKTLPKVIYEKNIAYEELEKKYTDLLNGVIPESIYISGCVSSAEMARHLEIDIHSFHNWCNNPDLKVPMRMYKSKKWFDKKEMEEWVLKQGKGFAKGKFKEYHIDKAKKAENK